MYKKKKDEIYEKADSPRDNFLGLKVTNETFNTNSSNHYNTDLSIPNTASPFLLPNQNCRDMKL